MSSFDTHCVVKGFVKSRNDSTIVTAFLKVVTADRDTKKVKTKKKHQLVIIIYECPFRAVITKLFRCSMKWQYINYDVPVTARSAPNERTNTSTKLMPR